MKKCNALLAILLAFLMLFSVSEAALAASCEPRDMVMALNIMDGPDNQSIVSRGEFANYLSRIIGEQQLNASTDAFSDLKPGDPYYAEISLMHSYGILNGDENGNVYAQKPVTFNEAVKMLMCLLGYGEYAQKIGGYPNGYLEAARESKLLKGVTMRGNGWLEEDEAAKLIYNALTVPILSADTIGTDGSVTYNQQGEKLLSIYRGLKRGEGVVTAVCGVDGVVGEKVEEKMLYINGVAYKVPQQQSGLLGYYVEFYYDNDNNIVAMLPVKNSEITKIPIKSVQNVTSAGIVYSDDEIGRGTIKIENDGEIYYNNAILTSLYDMDLSDKEGYITVIDHNDDSQAEYIFINAYYDILVGAVDTKEKEIYDLYEYDGKFRVINLDEDENLVRITNDFGTQMAFEDILPKQLFTVSESIDKKTVYLHYNEEEIEGRVEAIVSEDSIPKITINGIEYETSKYFNDNFDVKVSYAGRFLINQFGQIAAVFPQNDMQFGYVTAGGGKGVISPEYQLKILTEDNEFKIFTIAEKVEFNDTGIKGKAQELYNALCQNGSVVPQLIRYRTNADGDINYVEISDYRTGDYLNMFCNLSSSAYVSASKIFGGKITANSSTRLFVVPKTGTTMDDEDYRALPATEYLQRSTNYDALAYRTNTSSHYAEALVVPVDIQQMAFTNHSPVAVFDKLIYTKDENGNYQPCMTVYVGASKNIIPVQNESVLSNITDEEGDPHTLKRGDIIRYQTTLRGNAASITLLYNRETQLPVGSQTSGSWNSSFHYNSGYVYDISDGNMWLYASEPTSAVAVSDLNSYEISNIMVYDSTLDELRLGGTNDIMDYTHTGVPSKVFVFAKDAVTNLLFTVK